MKDSVTFLSSIQTAILPSSIEGIVTILVIVAFASYGFRLRHEIKTSLREQASRIEEARAAISLGNDMRALTATFSQRKAGDVLSTVWARLLAAKQFPTTDLQLAQSTIPILEERRLSFLRQLPNYLMLLGLLGTVLGLSLTVGQFAPQLKESLTTLATGGSPDALNDGMAGVLEKMKVAFTCTLWGVSASLLVSLFATQPSIRHRDHLQQELDALTLYSLAPLAWKDQVDRQEAQLDALEGNRDALMRLYKLMEAHQNSLTERTEQTVQALRQAGRDLKDSTDMTSQAALSAVRAAEGTTAASAQATLTLNQVSKGLDQTQTLLHQAAQRFDEQVHFLDQQHSLHLQASERIMLVGQEQRDQVTSLTQQFMQTSTALLAGMQGNFDEFDSARAALMGHTEQIILEQQRQHEALASSTAGIFNEVKGIVQNHQNVVEGVERHLVGVATALEPLTALTERLDPRNLPADRWTDFQTSLQDISGGWQAWQQEFQQNLSTLLVNHEKALLSEVRANHQALADQTHHTTTGLIGKMDEALTRWNVVYADLSHNTAGTLHGQMSLASQIKTEHESLRNERHDWLLKNADTTADLLQELRAHRQQEGETQAAWRQSWFQAMDQHFTTQVQEQAATRGHLQELTQALRDAVRVKDRGANPDPELRTQQVLLASLQEMNQYLKALSSTALGGAETGAGRTGQVAASMPHDSGSIVLTATSTMSPTPAFTEGRMLPDRRPLWPRQSAAEHSWTARHNQAAATDTTPPATGAEDQGHNG